MLSETIKINLNFDDFFFYMEWCNFDKIKILFFLLGRLYLFVYLCGVICVLL
jgi:hypothetical protein